MRQLKATCKIHFVELQPGDATRYTFFFSEIPETFSAVETTKNNEPISDARERHCFSGWGPGTYVLGLCIVDGTRIAFVDRYTIEHWGEVGEWRLEEIAARLGSTAYTAKVLLAALSVLIAEPSDMAGACQRMMQARSTYLSKV